MKALFARDAIPFLLLRAGVAFSFLYPPIRALQDPNSWIGYFPAFVRSLSVDQITLLHLFGIVEVAIALWILSGKRIFLPSVAAAAMLIVIVGFNFSQMDVVFRDLPIALMAIALALHARDGYNDPHDRPLESA